MNRFSDLLDSKHSITFVILLTPVIAAGVPNVTVQANQQVLFSGELDHAIRLEITELDLLQPLAISVAMSNKHYHAEQETAVIVESFKLDEFEFVPSYTHLFEYTNDHNNSQPTNYLGFNGVWSLTIDQPFYQWLHQVTGQGWLID
jgi:hypothetical protein